MVQDNTYIYMAFAEEPLVSSNDVPRNGKIMANVYKNAGFNLSTTNLTTVYTCPTDRTAIIKSIQINNDHSGAIQTEISVTDSSASATFKIYHKDIAADTTDNGVLSPLVLESGDIIKIQVDTANKIEGMISYLEIFDEKVLNNVILLVYLWN